MARFGPVPRNQFTCLLLVIAIITLCLIQMAESVPVAVDLVTRHVAEALTMKELQAKLKELGLPSTGRKDALVNRLLRSYSDDDKENIKKKTSNPIYCCVPLCHMNSDLSKKQGISMHRIPSGLERRLTRKKWLARLQTVRANLIVTDNTRVCGMHFLPECYSVDGKLHMEAVPTVFPSKPHPKSATSRPNPLDRVRKENTELPEGEAESHQMIQPIDSCPEGEAQAPGLCLTQSTQTPVHESCHCTGPPMKDFGCQTSLSDVNVDDLRNDDQKTRFLTGFTNYGTFMVIFTALLNHGRDRLNYWGGSDPFKEKKYHSSSHRKPGPSRRLDMSTEFLSVMMWYRLGLLEEHLATIFKVSLSTMSRILTTWSQFIYEHMQGIVTTPSREDVLQHMPLHFINHPNVFRVDDCTEFFMEKPSGLEAQALTWSEYKHHNTIKVLVGVTPDGLTTFVSRAWGGRGSDRHIVEQEDAFQNVPDGMAIMADKGFEVEDLLPPGVSLIMPPKVSSKCQRSDSDFFKTVNVAEPRIVVEMKMEQAKNYRILQTVFPISRAATSEQIIFNCFAFTNLLPQLFVTPDVSEDHVNLPIYN